MALVGITDCLDCGHEVSVSLGERNRYSYTCHNPRCGGRHVFGRGTGIHSKLRPLDEEPVIPAPKAKAPSKVTPPAAPEPTPTAEPEAKASKAPNSIFSWRNDK